MKPFSGGQFLRQRQKFKKCSTAKHFLGRRLVDKPLPFSLVDLRTPTAPLPPMTERLYFFLCDQ
jgi:hypothetical protein